MTRYTVEINGETVLRTDTIEELAQFISDNKLQAACSLENIGDFKHIALSADGDTVCGSVFNNGAH